MKPDKAQEAIIHSEKSCTVVGVPGSGKTRTLFWKIEALLKKDAAPEDIGILCFSYRNLLVMRHLAERYLGKATAGKLMLGTAVDLPLKVMKKATGEAPPRVADNNFMRRLLRQAMVEVGFVGHVNEAEHIVRTFKSHGKKPQQNEPHYELFQAYKQHLEQTGLVDRYDIVRKHIIGMRNDLYPPVDVKHIFVDHFQDITEIQSLWLVDHLKAGKKVYAFGCDDLTIFGRDGAQGAKAFYGFEEMNDVQRFSLHKTYRLPRNIAAKAITLVKPLKERLIPKMEFYQQGGSFEVFAYSSATTELEALADQVKAVLRDHQEATIGIITRYDLQARQAERALAAKNIPHTSFARSIWETPGATLVLDLLALFLDQSSKSRLRNVLSALGVTGQTIEALYTNGLSPEGWLSRGAPLPKGIESATSVSQLRELGLLRQKLVDYVRMMPSLGAKVVFKALAFSLIENLKEEEKRNATLALDELLTTKGNLKQIIATLTQHRAPDVNAQVTVCPVRESRNMAFTHVFIPFVTANNYPYKYKVLPISEDNDRRLLYMALSRAAEAVTILHTEKDPSPFLKEFI